MKRNRRMVLTLKDVLEQAKMLSRAGHPDDFIDSGTSRIRLKCSMSGKVHVVIDWVGTERDEP